MFLNEEGVVVSVAASCVVDDIAGAVVVAIVDAVVVSELVVYFYPWLLAAGWNFVIHLSQTKGRVETGDCDDQG